MSLGEIFPLSRKPIVKEYERSLHKSCFIEYVSVLAGVCARARARVCMCVRACACMRPHINEMKVPLAAALIRFLSGLWRMLESGGTDKLRLFCEGF